MAETPEERLARLRREVESTWTPPRDPDPGAPPDLGLVTAPAAEPEAPKPTEAPAPDPATPTPQPASPEPEPGPEPEPEPVAPAPAPTPAPAPEPARLPDLPASTASSRPSLRPTTASDDDGWSIADALGGASLGQWVAIGLLVVGGYLFLAQLFPWIGFPGSLVMTAAGLVLLWQHFGHRAGPWALYAGMILAFIGALRVIGDLMPFNVQGETSLGLGLALLTIAWLRHTQVGGWGWQGIAGAAALVWGLIQLGLGLFPGAPGVLDLVLPVLLLVGGGWLLVRTMGRRGA